MHRFAEIIREQQEELRAQLKEGKFIEREVLPRFAKLMDSSLIKVITGVRRCGKSVLSAQLLEGKKYGYVNFDDEKLMGIKTEELSGLLESVYEVYGKVDFLFLDEVQNVSGWELFVNRLQRQGLNIVVTGSNAKLLSRELATHLTGRHTAFELFPFSFREFLKYEGIMPEAATTKETGLIKKRLGEYIKSGGFPETLKEPNPKSYLKSLYSSILLKDILLRHRVRYVRTFRDLASYVMTNFAREVSFNKLKNIFNLGSDHTAKNYLSFLEESYLIFLIERFSYKKKESLVENRKSYVIDTGMIRAVSFRFSEDFSHVYENVVAIELLRRKNQEQEVYYWKNPQQEEVDFVVKEGLMVKQLIQVCYDIEDTKTKDREIRALIKAGRDLRCKNMLVITEGKEGEEKLSWFGIKAEVRFMPLWKWLLLSQ